MVTIPSKTVRNIFVQMISFVFVSFFVVLAIPAHAAGDRGIAARVAPVYPELAKRMKITGAVKVEATVDAAGKVTEAKAISGSKILEPAAEEAVRKWKFETGAASSTVEVEVNFAMGN